MKNYTFLCIALLTITQGVSQKKIWEETKAEKQHRMKWWTDARFGMFIHWGLYAGPARHEWVKSRETMTNEEYQKYFDTFNPDLFNPTEWAKKAKATGMKYAVITAKHHEGFNMFKSEFTDYHVANTPYGKDILKEWIDAFRAEGIKIGLYYSLIDWHHGEYEIDNRHPQRPAGEFPLGGARDYTNSAALEQDYKVLNKNRDHSFYKRYLHNQVKEILTNYGKIDILWLDYSYPGKFGKDRNDWDSVNLLTTVRELQPGIIVNDRADLKEYWGGWDFETPEQQIPPKWPMHKGEKVYWETCGTFSGSWGYNRDETSWKNTGQLLTMLIESVGKGGNLLLNVGPTARGLFDHRADNALEAIGEWMKFNSRSIYNCTQAPETLVAPKGTMYTYNPEKKILYMHVFNYPTQGIQMTNFKGKIKYAQFLHDASEIQFKKPRDEAYEKDLLLYLPAIKPNIEIPVVEIYLN